MKVLEYNLKPLVIGHDMKVIGEYPITVIVGLTKNEEEYINVVIDNELDIELLYDVVKQLNKVIFQYVSDEYSNNHPNEYRNTVSLDFKVETIEDISEHMYETHNENIATVWLDMYDKKQKNNSANKKGSHILHNGKSITYRESIEIKEGVFYHGTDARIVRMNSEERKSYVKDIKIIMSYMWPFFEPYKFRLEELKNAILCNCEDKKLWRKLNDAILRYEEMTAGNDLFQYSSFYLCNFISRAEVYAFQSFAFGESGSNAYYMLKAAETINFKGWNPPEEVLKSVKRIFSFANETPEPIIFKFTGIDIDDLQTEWGEKITEDKKGVLSCGSSFRYMKDIHLDLSNAIKLSKE